MRRSKQGSSLGVLANNDCLKVASLPAHDFPVTSYFHHALMNRDASIMTIWAKVGDNSKRSKGAHFDGRGS
jgi:hypothetical protein